MREMIPSAQLAAIERREIDVGLLRPPVDCPGLDVEAVVDEPLVAALPAGHALAPKKALALRDLAAEPWVLFPRRHGPGLFDIIMDACRDAGFTPRVAHEPNEMQAVLACVASELGVSLVPSSLSSLHAHDISYRKLRGLRHCISLAIASAAGPDSAVVRSTAATAPSPAQPSKKRASQPNARSRMTAAERFVTGNYSEADLEPVPVKCPACGNRGLKPVKGRFGPVWRCLGQPECKHFLDSKPTGRTCRHRTGGKTCGALMVEGTKTIPDRCSQRSCPNRNPHRL